MLLVVCSHQAFDVNIIELNKISSCKK